MLEALAAILKPAGLPEAILTDRDAIFCRPATPSSRARRPGGVDTRSDRSV